MNPLLHILFAAIAGAALRRALGGDRRLPEGDRRGARGDLDDHAQLDRDLGRRLPVRPRRAAPERHARTFVPISNDVVEGAKLPVFWGDADAPGPARRLLRRDRRARRLLADPQPDDARLRRQGGRLQPRGGALRRHQRLRATTSSRWRSPARSPGLAGAVDVLGWQFRLATSDIQGATIAFVGIAVALLGRNTAIGVALAALLFGGLLTGTSTRNLDPEIFKPELASNLTLLIQGLVVLFVGADVIVLWLLARAAGRRSTARR